MDKCIFCKIISKEMSSEIVYEDDKVIAFKDIAPKAPVHILIVPKRHIRSASHIEPEDKDLAGELFLVAKKVAKEQGVAESGYRLSFNVGRDAGQVVDHLHMHLLGGTRIPLA